MGSGSPGTHTHQILRETPDGALVEGPQPQINQEMKTHCSLSGCLESPYL